MRVIAGQFRSRQLKTLKGLALRPTSDRLRETLFNVLAELILDSRFLDMFAGTGAVGIEAISRGAKEVVFIENHPPAAALIKKNLDSLEIKSPARILTMDTLRGLKRLSTEPPFNILFFDPPYAAAADYQRVLDFLGDSELLHQDSVVIAEHRRNFDLPEHIRRLERVRVLPQGDAALSFYRLGC